MATEQEKLNAALRESIDLSNQLAKSVKSLSDNFRLSAASNEKLVKDIGNYKQLLSDTEKISNRISKGRVQDKEIESHITKLGEGYKAYIDANASSFARNGRFLVKQRDIQKEITKEEEKQVKIQNAIGRADANIDSLLKEKIKIEIEARRSVSSVRQKEIKDEVKYLNEKIKEEEDTIKYSQKQVALSDKIISKKKKEKKEITGIIKIHENIVKNHEDEISKAEILRKINKENSIITKLTSGNIWDMTQGIKEMAAVLTPLVVISDAIKNFAFGISEQVTKIQRGLVLSRDSAYDVRQDFNDIAVSSGDIAVTTERMIEANMALGKQLGFNSEFSSDLNIQFVKLTKQIGISEESAGGLAKLSKVTGITLKETKNTVLETVQKLSSQYGIQLDQRDVLEEIGNISGHTLAMFRANPKALAEAVAQAKLLGTTLEITKKQASSLLDFESSIESELQAELITGQQFNLERARSAALTGDMSTAMKELANQNIDFNRFSNMNVIAQEKVAKMMGLSTDELSNQLLKQNYLNKSREQIIALGGEEVANRIEALSAQDKFNLAVEKMKDILSSIVGGPFGKFIDAVASSAIALYAVVGGLAAISLAKTIASLAAMALELNLAAAGAIATVSAVTLGLGMIAVAVGIAAGIAALASAKTEATTPLADGGLAYGPTNALVGEYAGANNNPEVIAPLSDLQSILGRSGVSGGGSQEAIGMLNTLNETMKDVRNSINQIGNKEGKVYLGSQQVGTAQLMGNYNLA